MNDFWASVVPAYLGALSSVAGTAIALVSLVISVRARRKATAASTAMDDTLQTLISVESGARPGLREEQPTTSDRYEQILARLRQTA